MKLQELEDLYLPYKPKKRTRATVAKEKGLEPLALLILNQAPENRSLNQIAEEYINPEKELHNVNDVLQGARDIIAETISENADIRKVIREKTYHTALLETELRKAEQRTVYEVYYEYSEALKKMVPHRILAINRGEKEGVLKVSVSVDQETMIEIINKHYLKKQDTIFSEQITMAAKDSYERLIAPAISREVRGELTDKAEEQAIHVFSENLKKLLLQPPVRNIKIMGIDPGFRTGSKVAVIDETGKYLEGTTIYPHPPQNEYIQAKTTIRKLVEKHDVPVIAIGNGTASRETEQMIADLISELKTERKLEYIIVNEAGASVYSASKTARDEFPDLDASMRGNISIARRLQDPLSELVKIDPKSIGVGLYQHDVNQKRLNDTLSFVVESAVNNVGVNLNTASMSLLKHVSGLTSKTAQNIINFRDKNGPFKNRFEIQEVDGIGEVAFEQAAGFLRIPDGQESLDNTAIHPESYEATRQLLKKLNIKDITTEGKMLPLKLKEFSANVDQLLDELGIGKPTFNDIIENIKKPGLDPRDELPKPILKSDILKAEDLKVGMVLKGTVRNVVDFGAFVDIGVKNDGLVHKSQLADKFVKNPLEFVSVGDIVEVRVVSIDLERGRIGLTMRKDKI